MKDFIFEQTGGIGLLHFSGRLTADSEGKMLQGFMTSFERSDYVVVNFKNVTGLDAGCFRLFCKAYRIFTRFNKRLYLIGLGPKVVSAADPDGRQEGRPYCVSECRDGCLWGGILNETGGTGRQ